MKKVPPASSERGRTFTVSDFYEAGCADLQLTLAAGGRNLDRVIEEPIANRPGLALTGFYRHFAWKRLQVVGKAEMAYLESLPEETRRRRIQELIRHKAFCFIFTNGQRPSAVEMDLAERAGAVLMTSPMKTRHFVHRSAFVLERLAAPATSIYGTMVEVCGLGVMIEGDPGLGKSETALGLVKKGHALVADDLTCIRREVGSSVLYGSASDSTAGYMEIRGIGILNVPRIFGVAAVRGEKRLELVVTFRRLQDVAGEIDRTGQTRRTRTILGVDVPNVVIPVSAGRDLVNLVETAAMQQKLLAAGHDPVADLSERLKRRAEAAGAKKRTRKGG